MFTESKAYRIFTGSNKIHAPISLLVNSFLLCLIDMILIDQNQFRPRAIFF